MARARQAGSDKTPEDLADQGKTHGKISPDNHSFNKSGPEGDLDCFHQCSTFFGERGQDIKLFYSFINVEAKHSEASKSSPLA